MRLTARTIRRDKSRRNLFEWSYFPLNLFPFSLFLFAFCPFSLRTQYANRDNRYAYGGGFTSGGNPFIPFFFSSLLVIDGNNGWWWKINDLMCVWVTTPSDRTISAKENTFLFRSSRRKYRYANGKTVATINFLFNIYLGMVAMLAIGRPLVVVADSIWYCSNHNINYFPECQPASNDHHRHRHHFWCCVVSHFSFCHRHSSLKITDTVFRDLKNRACKN